MTEIRIDDYIFSVDVEKTKEYYRNNSLCECEYCQYFNSNIIGKFPNNQKDEYFSFTVFGISLSCDSAKEIKENPSPLKIKKYFKKSR